jgi:uncharacterized protein YtpQ (UPF0354 family)
LGNLRSRVMPCIKAAIFGETGPSVGLSFDDSPVIRDLKNGLLVLYVADIGQSLRFVQNRHLPVAGMDAESIHAAVMANFVEFIAERTRMQPHGNIFALFVDGNFEANLLLVDSLWDESLASYAPNGFVAAVPACDMLAFADAASASGISELRDVVSRVFPNGRNLIASDLYCRQDGRWIRYAGEQGDSADRPRK